MMKLINNDSILANIVIYIPLIAGTFRRDDWKLLYAKNQQSGLVRLLRSDNFRECSTARAHDPGMLLPQLGIACKRSIVLCEDNRLMKLMKKAAATLPAQSPDAARQQKLSAALKRNMARRKMGMANKPCLPESERRSEAGVIPLVNTHGGRS